MKKLLLVLILLFATPALANPIWIEEAMNNGGQTFFRVHNQTGAYLTCFYVDARNSKFFFSMGPHSVSLWYPTYGMFYWECS